jgi:hypothetical protein
MPMVPLLRQGIPLNSEKPFMKIMCACPRQQHAQEAITPLLSAMQLVMVSVVHGEMEATKKL